MRRRTARAAALEWLDRMGLADRADVKLDALSKGNQQKVQFISAVLHRPAFAVLDEPFSGLDPLNQELFAGVIRELRDEGMTVLLSAHQMQLVEKLADRVLLMNHGREVLSGTVDEMRQQTRAMTRLGLHVRGNADPTRVRRPPGRGRRRVERQRHVGAAAPRRGGAQRLTGAGRHAGWT